MYAKPNPTRDEIVEAALDIVSLRGMEGLTMRKLRNALDCSYEAIVEEFESLEEVQIDVRAAARRHFENLGEWYVKDIPVHYQTAMRLILYGLKKPWLFQIVCLPDGSENQAEYMKQYMERVAGPCQDALREAFGLTEEDARKLFEDMWIYAFGLGTLCAARICHYTEDEIIRMLERHTAACMGKV